MRVAVVRGANLNPWELRNFELPADVTAFGSRRAAFSDELPVPVRRLPSPNDLVAALPPLAAAASERLAGSLEYLVGLGSALRGFDIAHVAELHTPYSLQAIEARNRGACRRVVVTAWENIAARPTPNRLVERRIARVATGADHFVAITDRARVHLELAGAPRERITVLPMGINLEGFPPVPLRDGDGPLRITSIGRLVWEKGMGDLVVAIRLLQDQGVPAELTLVGQGVIEGRLRQLAGSLGIADRISFKGGVPYRDIPALHRGTDVFVLASTPLATWREQYGFALVEAMASGLPVVAGDSGSLPEIVADPDSLVRPHDPVALAARLAELAGDSELRQAQGARNRAWAEQRYDRRRVGAELLGIYERVLGT